MSRRKFNPVLVKVDDKKGPESTIKDERIFTSQRKLTSYLKMIRNHYQGAEIEFKQYKV